MDCHLGNWSLAKVTRFQHIIHLTALMIGSTNVQAQLRSISRGVDYIFIYKKKPVGNPCQQSLYLSIIISSRSVIIVLSGFIHLLDTRQASFSLNGSPLPGRRPTLNGVLNPPCVREFLVRNATPGYAGDKKIKISFFLWQCPIISNFDNARMHEE